MNPETHVRQLAGIADRHPGWSLADCRDEDAAPVRDRSAFVQATRCLRRRDCVTATTYFREGPEEHLEIVVDAETVPTPVMDILVQNGLELDPDRTAARPGHTVVVAVPR